jgi:hypothetical protein
MEACAFLLIKTKKNSIDLFQRISKENRIFWGSNVFGPFQIVICLVEENEKILINKIEKIRDTENIDELDARVVKNLPNDEHLRKMVISKSNVAVLLINVNYKEGKERDITYSLREVSGVITARAMWGPTDIIAIVETHDKEHMRNVICDNIKLMKGVKTNTTLYCYPNF